MLVAILVLREIGWLAIHDMPSSELTDPNANDHPIGRGPKMKNGRIDKLGFCLPHFPVSSPCGESVYFHYSLMSSSFCEKINFHFLQLAHHFVK